MSEKNQLVYDVNDKSKGLKDTFVYSLQWLLIMTYGVVFGYAIVGVAFNFEPSELGLFMSRVILSIGISTFIQVLLGHKFAMMSGPNIITNLAIVSSLTLQGNQGVYETFSSFVLSGLIIAVLGYFGILSKIGSVWTRYVSGSMIMMVGLTTSFAGMSMISEGGIDLFFVVGVALALFCGVVSIRGKGLLSTIPVALTIFIGYLVYILMGRFNWDLVNQMPNLIFPILLPYGFHLPSVSNFLTIFIVTLFSAVNMYGNIKGYSGIVKHEVSDMDERRSFGVFGIIEVVLSSLIGAPPTVPYGENLGFVLLTRVASRSFLLIASFIFVFMGFSGKIAGFMAAMPGPVAGSILLGVASTCIGLGLSTISNGKSIDTREIFIVGFSIFFALGVSNLPLEVLESTNSFIAVLFGNPVILVILLVVILEQIVFRKEKVE